MESVEPSRNSVRIRVLVSSLFTESVFTYIVLIVLLVQSKRDFCFSLKKRILRSGRGVVSPLFKPWGCCRPVRSTAPCPTGLRMGCRYSPSPKNIAAPWRSRPARSDGQRRVRRPRCTLCPKLNPSQTFAARLWTGLTVLRLKALLRLAWGLTWLCSGGAPLRLAWELA